MSKIKITQEEKKNLHANIPRYNEWVGCCLLRNKPAQTSSSSSFIFPFPFYRIHLKGYSGTAGKISSIGQPGSDFSTKDADNDKCVCKCSQLTTGGKKNTLSPMSCAFKSLCFGRNAQLWRQFIMALALGQFPTHPNLGTSNKNLQGHFKHSRTSVVRSKSTISSELITDQLSWEFGLYNGWH